MISSISNNAMSVSILMIGVGLLILGAHMHDPDLKSAGNLIVGGGLAAFRGESRNTFNAQPGSSQSLGDASPIEAKAA